MRERAPAPCEIFFAVCKSEYDSIVTRHPHCIERILMTKHDARRQSGFYIRQKCRHEPVRIIFDSASKRFFGADPMVLFNQMARPRASTRAGIPFLRLSDFRRLTSAYLAASNSARIADRLTSVGMKPVSE